jgi:Lrp/AsnC family transcriptional regulator for asnA, asnC and gidA
MMGPFESLRNRLPVPRKGHGVDNLDFQILEMIKDFPRIATAELATALSVAEVTVRRRRARLEKDGFVRYFALPNPRKLGYLDEMVWVKVEPSALKSVAQTLAESPRTRDVDIMNGPYNLLVTGYFTSADDFLDFLTEVVAPLPGVIETQNTNSLRTMKRYFNQMDPVVETD